MMQFEKKEIESFNILKVEVGTNCPMGGDAGHGGKTILRLSDEASTAWDIVVKDSYGNVNTIESPKEIELKLYGDSEAETFIEALEFAVNTLKKQIKAK
jgi:hypothetical protein